VQSLDFARDLEAIAEVARALYLPDAAAPGSVIPQFDGYFALEDVPLKTLLERKLHPHEYLGGGNGIATTTQILKQADVVLMLFLFGERYDLHTKAANFKYYEPRTEGGSSLSACSYSLIAAEIGKVDWAYQYFMKTATIDLTGEGKQYVGTLYIGGTHAAGSGVDAAVFGLWDPLFGRIHRDQPAPAGALEKGQPAVRGPRMHPADHADPRQHCPPAIPTPRDPAGGFGGRFELPAGFYRGIGYSLSRIKP
jgi:hypothetical protein